MITPQELRIGNFVHSPYDGHVIKINPADIFLMANGHHREARFEPIELTEEWLLKFGLETDNEVDEIDGVMFKLYHLEDYIIEYWIRDNKFKFTDDCALEVFVSSVHQLQNLNLALTGEELTIK
ncbi:hypothetical protein [Chryseobacterium rhizosphaerae]|uniref:hypothetical protein n=1 Tax=Chryseobacterium rhizosphaerae TaxID=395937 RepID=UPI003D0EDC54